MKKIFAVIIFTVAVIHAQLPGKQALNNRDDKNDLTYKISVSPTQNERNSIFSKVREFIWEHWTSQQIGKVKLESYTKEGGKILRTFEIKKLENGQFILDINNESNYFDRKNKKTFKNITSYSGENIQRIRKPKDGFVKEQVIPQTVVFSPEMYFLRIKDNNGKVLMEF